MKNFWLKRRDEALLKLETKTLEDGRTLYYIDVGQLCPEDAEYFIKQVKQHFKANEMNLLN